MHSAVNVITLRIPEGDAAANPLVAQTRGERRERFDRRVDVAIEQDAGFLLIGGDNQVAPAGVAALSRPR